MHLYWTVQLELQFLIFFRKSAIYKGIIIIFSDSKNFICIFLFILIYCWQKYGGTLNGLCY